MYVHIKKICDEKYPAHKQFAQLQRLDYAETDIINKA